MSNNTQRSAFAESAYADAERRSSRELSRGRCEEIDEYNLLYYEDGTIIDDHHSQSNVVHADFQPLAGKLLLKLQLRCSCDKLSHWVCPLYLHFV